MMDPSQANPREYQRQAIDTEIKALEESIRALRYRRNALAPVSSLPTEVIYAIFSFVRFPGTSLGGKPDHHLAGLRVAHVCHQWREIALNQSLFWSHVDFSNLTLAGVAEILARAKKSPLHLEARVTEYHWDDARLRAFEKELWSHVSHIYHLNISTDSDAVYDLRGTLEGLTSPAPTLEYLSLSRPAPSLSHPATSQPHPAPWRPIFVPDTLFDGTTPRLSSLKLHNLDVGWKSPLLKGLRHLELRRLSEGARPSLTYWLDALDEMPRLQRLVLHSASPVAPPFPWDVVRTVTLPFLTHLDVSASTWDCALALAHLDLPVLTMLCLKAIFYHPDGDNRDVHKLLPYVARHTHGPQDPQPLQSVLIHGNRTYTDILAWPVPDIVVEVHDTPTWHAATLTARVALSIHSAYIGTLDAAMAALSLDSVVTLTAQHHTRFNEQFWLDYAPRWPLLQHVRLAAHAARGFGEMLLDSDRHECPLLPSLTRLDLIDDTALSVYRTFRLCDGLRMRVELGVPLETLDLRTCRASDIAVQLFSEIVVDVWGPFSPDNDPDAYSEDEDDDDPYANNGEEWDEEEEEDYY